MGESIDSLMSGFPPAANDQVKASAWRVPRHARWSFNHLRQLLPTAPIAASTSPAKLISARQNLANLVFFDQVNQKHDFEQFCDKVTRSGPQVPGDLRFSLLSFGFP